MSHSKKIFLGVGVIFAVLATLYVVGFLILQKSAPDPETAVFNSRYGFFLRYPKNWVVDDSKSQGPAEFIKEPTGNAFVAVQILEDSRLKASAKRVEVRETIETSFKTDPQSTIEYFEWQKGQGENYSESYWSGGIFKDKQNKEWRFEETGILHGDGTIVTLRSMVVAEQAETYTKILSDIIYSFAPTVGITSDEAIDKVKGLMEVRQYTSDLVMSGSKAKLNFEDGGDTWNVQVFEVVEQGGDGHTATFNWYYVDKKTGTITSEFDSIDK